MLRAQLARRALLGVAAASFVPPRERPSIYPQEEERLVLVETPSELERHIGAARESVLRTYGDSYLYIQGWVSRWIAVEHAVERRIKSFRAKDEPLTPGTLYVGVATLTGSILARTRGLPSRRLLPPALFLLSFHHFLPHTAHNIGAYISDLGHTYTPRAAQFVDTGIAHTKMSVEMVKEKTRGGRLALERGLVVAIDAIQESTGLKLREALGLSRPSDVEGDHSKREERKG